MMIPIFQNKLKVIGLSADIAEFASKYILKVPGKTFSLHSITPIPGQDYEVLDERKEWWDSIWDAKDV